MGRCSGAGRGHGVGWRLGTGMLAQSQPTLFSEPLTSIEFPRARRYLRVYLDPRRRRGRPPLLLQRTPNASDEQGPSNGCPLWRPLTNLSRLPPVPPLHAPLRSPILLHPTPSPSLPLRRSLREAHRAHQIRRRRPSLVLPFASPADSTPRSPSR